MSVDPTALANLLALAQTSRVPVCEYIKVTWAAGVINYYGAAAWHDIAPFTGVGQVIEARLMPENSKSPFHELEIDPDLRTEVINITFEDIDKTITTKFQTYSSGVECEVFLYYPSPAPLTISIWKGQLQAPSIYGRKTVKATATNGYRSRELTIPSRRRPRECTASIFGGLLPDTDAVRSSLCPYDRHLGGTVGNYKTGVTPYADCPKTLDACIDRLSNSGKYFGGFNTDASATLTDPVPVFFAISKGNASSLTEPIRWIFGTKYVKGLQLLLWRRESSNWVGMVWEVGEGPVSSIYNFKVNEVMQQQMHMNLMVGTRGQPRTAYAFDVSNFSSTAHVFTRDRYTNNAEISPANLQAECEVKGFAEVCVYTSASPVTKTRIWSNDRVWCLLEVYKNQKCGLGYAESKFNIADWITASAWSIATVSHTVTFPDGETTTYISRRSTFNAILEGRAVAEQVEDICRSGGLSVPFEHEGTFTLATFRTATAGELTAARVFTDTGSTVNIIWDNGQPMIELSQVPDNKLVNEVEARFEEASNNGKERSITVDDPNQKLKAGRQMGPDYFLSVPKRYVAFGITSLAETIRFAYRMLKFGQFDEGGTDNNLRVTLTVPFEQILNIKRYDIIKIVSDILDGFTIGSVGLTETPQYFRVLSLKKISNGRAKITAQAYNHTAYTAFEVSSGGTASSFHCTVWGAGAFQCDGLYEYLGQLNGKPYYGVFTNTVLWTGTAWEIQADGVTYYTSASAVAFPWLATWSLAAAGIDPVPYVSEGNPFEVGATELTLDTLSYNTGTGVLSVPILS